MDTAYVRENPPLKIAVALRFFRKPSILGTVRNSPRETINSWKVEDNPVRQLQLSHKKMPGFGAVKGGQLLLFVFQSP